MLDDYQIEQNFAYKIIKNTIKKNRCSHAYIIESNGTDKALEFAIALSKYLFCPYSYSNNENCHNCSQCKTIDDNNFIELKIIKADGMWIKKSQLDELQKEFQNKSLIGSKKIYIIENADKLNPSSSNSILKFLEEPNEGIIAILIVNNIYQLMPTIISRCQIISLNKKDSLSLNEILKSYNIEDVELKEKIKNCIDFIRYFEKYKLEALTKLNTMYLKYFKEKENMKLGLEIFILFYTEILNQKLSIKSNLFEEYNDIIKEISSVNTQNQLCEKIKIILKLQEKIKINMNSSLLMDKLIIELERIK